MLTGRRHSACRTPKNAQEKALKYKIKRGKKHSRRAIFSKALDGLGVSLLLLFPSTLTPTATPTTTKGTTT